MIKPTVHIIHRKYANGERAYTLRWACPVTGRYKSRKVGPDKLLAREERRKVIDELQRGGNGEPRCVSWSDFVKKYLEMSRLEKAASAVAEDQKALEDFTTLCHPVGPHAITYEMVQEFRQKLVRRNKPITVNKKVKVIRAALNEARRLRYIDEVPETKLFEVALTEPNAFTPEERQKLFEVLPDAKWRAFSELGFTTSSRKMDLLSLRWEHVNFEDRSLLIYEKKRQRRDLRPRWAAMTDDTYTYLRELHTQSPKRLVAGEYIPKAPWVFTTKTGAQWRYNINRQWDRWLKKAGLSHHVIHDMRRTAPTDMERMNYGEKTKQAVTGHRTGQVMRDYYIRVDRDVIREAAERVSQQKRA